jgi:uncharacterized protein YabE (DUF348 family)
LRIHRTAQATAVAVTLTFVGGALLLASRTNVVLIVGHQARSISTNSANVGDLLEGQGIELSSGTRVAPPLATILADGMTVVVSPAPRAPVGPLTRSVAFDTMSSVVNPALTGVGVWVVEGASSGPAARIAAELAEAPASVDNAGTSPVVSVRAVVTGKVYDVISNAGTAGELLSAMGITPGVDDRVQPPPSTPLHSGSIVVFDSVQVLTRTAVRSIPFATRTTWSAQLSPGQERIVSRGRAGLTHLTERVVLVNGDVASRTVLARDVVRRPALEVRVSGPASPDLPPGPGGQAAGKATWYDPPWSGLTAASPWIPFGTRVTVTDLASGRTVIVVIDDRGPFGPGRIIDLSPEAFSLLAPLGRGVLDVRIDW